MSDRLTTLLARRDVPDGIVKACKSESGARQYRCAFQINPFDYNKRHSKTSAYADETTYNNAVVQACLQHRVEVVAVTDHFRFDASVNLVNALRDADICVFPAFEANSSEGIHLLCLFPENEDASAMNRHIGHCGVTDLSEESPQSTITAEQICKTVFDRGGLSIAAHATSASGVLAVLSGQSRARCWKSEHLLAAAIAGTPDTVQDKYRSIIINKDSATKRDRSLAIINANDVTDPDMLGEDSATTLVKMSSVSIEGLRQAFLDHESRIQLNSEAQDTPHTEIIAVSWDGGLLDGQSVRLNDGLNVLIGGRGSGKSTFIESIRYALALTPRGNEAMRSHDAIMKAVIRPGTEISVLLHSPYPSTQYYLIRRLFGNKPNVYDETGELLPELKPRDVIGNLEVYGQHEISELTRKSGEIADILRRFIVTDDIHDQGYETVASLKENANSIIAELSKLEQLEASLSVLPELREKIKRFKAAKLEEKLKSKIVIDEEARVFQSLDEEITAFEARAEDLCLEEYDDILPEDIEERALNPETLKSLSKVQDRLIDASERTRSYLLAVANQARERTEAIKTPWLTSQDNAEKQYAQTLKELSKQGEDGTAFVRVRDQIGKLAPKEKQKIACENRLSELRTARQKLLVSFEQEKAEDLRDLGRAAKRVTKKLKNKVRVEIQATHDLESLDQIISNHVAGQYTQAMSKLVECDPLNLSEFAKVIRAGSDALQLIYGFSKTTAQKFAEAGEALALDIEAHHLRPDAVLSLNVGITDKENWKSIEQLSTGQKATAVLLLLLLESDAPLIIDQPEDDLDNRFIVGSIVSSIRKEKGNRQFIFSSHNANIPVLGDAEQIIGLSPIVEAGTEYAEITDEHCGSIDTPSVKEMVKELLEGGQKAFEFRRAKYGF